MNTLSIFSQKRGWTPVFMIKIDFVYHCWIYSLISWANPAALSSSAFQIPGLHLNVLWGQGFKQLLGKQGLEFFGRESLRIASIAGQRLGFQGDSFARQRFQIYQWLPGMVLEDSSRRSLKKIDSKLYLNLEYTQVLVGNSSDIKLFVESWVVDNMLA